MSSNDPAIKTKQYKHQEEVYLLHRDARYFGLFWEMGLGKSKLIQDVAAHNFLKGKIQTLIVVAPNSVYKNWVSQELPKHMAPPYVAMAYPKGGSDYAKMKRTIFLDPDSWEGKFRILCISFDSIRTDHGFEFVRNMMLMHKTFLVPDESTEIKSHGAVITKRMKALGQYATMKWICTGTPVSESPFAIHSQIEFLDEYFWESYGMKSFGAFKNTFGEFKLRRIGRRRFNELEKYKRLDYLNKIITPISSRLLKEDAGVDLPPKVYSTRTFDMLEKQRSTYDELKNQFRAELADGLELDAALAIVRLTKLQQITSGFVNAEEWEEPAEAADNNYTQEVFDFAKGNAPQEDFMGDVRPIEKRKVAFDIVPVEDNPRLQLLKDILSEINHKVIVWARFRRDIDIICEALGDKCVRYDGTTKGKDREKVLDAFRDPTSSVKILVANITSLSHGVTLTIAKTMIYYSNSFSLERRLQSEDRFHRIGQDAKSVLIIDLAADETIDLHIIDTLKNKYKIAAEVMGDRLRSWL